MQDITISIQRKKQVKQTIEQQMRSHAKTANFAQKIQKTSSQLINGK